MSFFKEFRDFAMRGNVVDMAIGIVIGAAFGKIVSSLVDNVIMPPIGVLIGGINFRDMGITIKQATGSAPAVILRYGDFLNKVVEFIIIAFVLFLVVKAMNQLFKKKEEEKPPAPIPEPTKEEILLTEIRDILKSKA